MPTLYYIIMCLSLSSQSIVHGFSPVSPASTPPTVFQYSLVPATANSWNTRTTPSTLTRIVRIPPSSAIASGGDGGDSHRDDSHIDGPPTPTTTDEPLLSELKDQVIEAASNSSSSSSNEGAGGGDTSAPSSQGSVSVPTMMGLDGSSKAELKPEDEFLKVNSSAQIQTQTQTQTTHDLDPLAATATVTAAAFDVSSSPPLTFQDMQEKQVPVTIRYSQVSGLRSFYLSAAKKITQSNPDVIIERMILPAVEGESEESSLFEILVDGRVIIGKGRSKWQSVSRNVNGPATSGMSVFISMQEIDAAIAKARKKRRPSTAYVRGAEEGGTPAIRLEMLKVGRNGKEEEHWEEQQS